MNIIRTIGLLFLGLSCTLFSVQASPGKQRTTRHKRLLPEAVKRAEYRGVVYDGQNMPVAGALIKVSGSELSTVSDTQGSFSIQANSGDKLLVSYTGFKSVEYLLGSSANISIVLESSSTLSLKQQSAVQQVYYSTPQRLSVSSTDAVYNEDIIKSPVASPANTLTGRLAGLYTLQSVGLPGADAASLTLRGQSPVVVIDGVVTNLSSFDLEEIESVTVLKDALATAMLGVRGSHGAVVVTTKKGRNAKQQLSFTAQSAIQQPLAWPKTVNAYDYASLRNEALSNDGVDPNSGLYYSQAALDAYRNHSDPINYPDVNYREAVTKNRSLFNRYTISSTGGNNFSRYFVALDHVNQSGFFKTVDSNSYNTNNNFKSYVIRSNVDINITPKLSAGLYLLGRIQNANEPGATTASILSNIINTPANAYPLLNQNHSFAGTQLYQNNVLAQTISSGYRQRFFRDVLVNLYLQRKLDDVLKGLWVKAKVAYNSTLAEDINRSKTVALFQQNGSAYTQFGVNGDQANSNGIGFQGRTDYQEFSIGYDRSFSKHGLSMLVVANRDNATDVFDPQALPYTIIGTSGRFAYNYDGKYIVEGAFGLNGSNRYPDNGNTKFGFFPAVGLGWNIESEDFMKSISAINRLKLYASYGVSGWDNPGYFTYYQRYFDGPSPYFGTGPGTITSITEGTIANPNITFEKANKLNIGISGGLLANRLTFTAEYFNNKHYDLVMQRGANSTLLGNDYPDENIGENRYFGWEGQLGWQQQVKQLQYFLSFNLSTVGSEALNIDEVNRPFSWMRRTGQPVGQQFGYVAEGLFQNQSEINNSATTLGYTPQPGDIKYRDLSGDGIIDQNDVTAIGNTNPLLFYGISMGLSWKGFDLSALLQGVENRNVYVGGSTYWAFQNNGTGQAYTHNLNRWTPQNAASASYPRLSYGSNANNFATSSFWVRSGDYFRLKNAEIGYSLPASVIGKIKVSSLRVFVNGYNLLTHASSELEDRDPEANFIGYPIQRLYNFGVNVKF